MANVEILALLKFSTSGPEFESRHSTKNLCQNFELGFTGSYSFDTNTNCVIPVLKLTFLSHFLPIQIAWYYICRFFFPPQTIFLLNLKQVVSCKLLPTIFPFILFYPVHTSLVWVSFPAQACSLFTTMTIIVPSP